MVSTCYVFVGAKTNASLHLASNNLNSLDGIFSMKLIEGEVWKLSLTSKMMCHVDKMSCQNVATFLHQMPCYNLVLSLAATSTLVFSLGCPSFSTLFAYVT
jgi:hypothetical protein